MDQFHNLACCQNAKSFHFQEKEKQWRQQNLTIARMEAQRNEELRRVRAEQMRQREEIAAISVSYHEFEISVTIMCRNDELDNELSWLFTIRLSTTR